MNFLSYKINTKHRNKCPTSKASIWSVSTWNEIQLFGIASENEWFSPSRDILWSARNSSCGKLEKLGDSVKNKLFIAKFRCDNNHEWHGYPVLPRDRDIPPEEILESWKLKGIIDKREKRKIQKGQFL